jgi:hypothetical protein
MITRAQIEKLGALHAVEPTMLSLYLAVPPPNLTARAGELIISSPGVHRLEGSSAAGVYWLW